MNPTQPELKVKFDVILVYFSKDGLAMNDMKSSVVTNTQVWRNFKLKTTVNMIL